MWKKPSKTADLFTFTKETLNEKLHVFAVICVPDIGVFLQISSQNIMTASMKTYSKTSERRLILRLLYDGKSFQIIFDRNQTTVIQKVSVTISYLYFFFVPRLAIDGHIQIKILNWKFLRFSNRKVSREVGKNSKVVDFEEFNQRTVLKVW